MSNAKAVASSPRGQQRTRKTKAKPTTQKTTKARAPRLSAATALATLLAVMTGSDKDHVRVSAAKIILARLAAQEEQKMRKRQATAATSEPNRQAALDAIAQLLDELALAKTAGAGSPAALDQGGAAKPAHAGG